MSALVAVCVPFPQQCGDFSSVGPHQEAAAGGALVPGSNTGPKGGDACDRSSLQPLLIDFLTVTLEAGALKRSGCNSWRELLAHVFDLGDRVVMGSIQKRAWQFYDEHAVLIDRTDSVCGKIGWATSEKHRRPGSVCISLTGAATRHMPGDLPGRSRLLQRLEALGAKISRIDIAADDLEGRAINVRELDAQAKLGKDGAFCGRGRPPESKFIDDNGSGKGCTLYVGQKGHKELCVYEKGKQLGDLDSRYTRCELRLYAGKVHIPLSVLVNLDQHFAGAYRLLADFVVAEATRLLTKDRVVDCSVAGWTRTTKQQFGTGLWLARRALGDEQFLELVRDLERPGVPGRFDGIDGDIAELFRQSRERSHEAESDCRG